MLGRPDIQEDEKCVHPYVCLGEAGDCPAVEPRCQFRKPSPRGPANFLSEDLEMAKCACGQKALKGRSLCQVCQTAADKAAKKAAKEGAKA